MATEEHGWGRQLARFRVWPRWARVGLAAVAGLGALSVLAGLDQAWVAAALLGAAGLALAGVAFTESGSAVASALRALERPGQEPASEGPDFELELERRIVDARLAGGRIVERSAGDEA